MATKHMSPTAQLLRQSRLFSLPPPLPRPNHNPSSSAALHESDTATLPYPTHASIETTQSSLARGDWGLKRPLPQQSTTATTTPVIRIGAIDSMYHITDFDSAADHTLTLRKWQEMSIPITMPRTSRSKYSIEPRVSTFEEDLNRTDLARNRSVENTKRWKYRGPWLAGKSQGEFEDYLTRKIKNRRSEFRKYLRSRVQEKMSAAARQAAIEDGKDLPMKPIAISEPELQAEIIKLRQNQSELWGLIWDFLDLPGFLPGPEHVSERLGRVEVGFNESGEADAEVFQGPPSTHRSAGLSYLRTSSHVPNHPILGPMNTRPPVQGRILAHGSAASSNNHKVMVGVGGVVALGIPAVTHRGVRPPQWTNFEPDLEGGAKAWMVPREANIYPSGRILLSTDAASDDTVALWEGVLDKEIMAAYATSSNNQNDAESATSDRGSKGALRKEEREPLPTKVYHDPEKRETDVTRQLGYLLEGLYGKQERLLPKRPSS
ncbi:hypothetical protein MMC13_008021 [Lambiella insularis]|nr:hypothetical protein [Lambiella insularis]